MKEKTWFPEKAETRTDLSLRPTKGQAIGDMHKKRIYMAHIKQASPDLSERDLKEMPEVKWLLANGIGMISLNNEWRRRFGHAIAIQVVRDK